MESESSDNLPSSLETKEMMDINLVKETGLDEDKTMTRWKGSLTLPEWFGYVSHLTEPCQPDEQQPLSNPINLYVIAADSMPLNHLGQQSIALKHFVKQQPAIQKKMLLEIWKMFAECYDDQHDDLFASPEGSELLSWEGREEKANNPTEADLAKLKELIGPYAVEIYPTNGEIPIQIMMKFGCWWDSEHGLEVLLEEGEVKDIDNEAATRPAAFSLL